MARIAFVTGHSFGVRALEGILSSAAWLDKKLSIPLIVALGSENQSRTVGYASPEPLALAAGAQLVWTLDGRLLDVAPALKSCEIDYLLVVGWSRLVPDEVLEIPRREIAGLPGAIGMHPTLLPVGRGRAPIPWTILHGLSRTGLTTFRLDSSADSGAILFQTAIAVRPNETSTTLFHRIGDLHYHAGAELAEALGDGVLSPRPQAEKDATNWPKRTPADSQLLPSFTVAEAERLMRAQRFPYPPSFIRAGLIDIPVHNLARTLPRDMASPATSGQWIEFAFRDGVAWLWANNARPEES